MLWFVLMTGMSKDEAKAEYVKLVEELKTKYN